MCKLGIGFFVLLGQRDPDLYAVESLAAFPELVIGAFGVDDAASGGHPVHRAGLDRLHAAETVPMNDRAVAQVGHGSKPDMRMRTHVDPCSRRELSRSHLIEENERPYVAPLRRRQHASDFKPADVARPRHHDTLQSPAARCYSRLWLFRR